MKVLCLSLLVVVGLVSGVKKNEDPNAPKLWALIVAGSNGYYNYRHQADVCHAYQILHAHGIPDERIVVMMYDDIAHNHQNPTPGIIINHPMGKDVYHGVPKDYVGDDVTPENFLKILQGQDMTGVGSGKVIKSGPNDHVFVNFVDHGATGLVAFPSGELTVKELNSALLKMHQNNQYKQLVFYMEACESGSMFRNTLPKNINIYATTAANFNESSYACYYDKKRETYLGDVYSVKWMENSDKANLHTETLLQQFKITKKETNTSHVEEYGDLAMGREPVADFQGEQSAPPIHYPKVPGHGGVSPCYEAPLDILMKRHSYEIRDSKRQQIFQEIQTMKKKRVFVEEVYRSLVRRLVNGVSQTFKVMKQRPKQLTQLDCHTDVVHHFSNKCFNLGKNPYALKFVYMLANMCEEGIETQQILSTISTVCRNVREIPGGVH